MLLLISLNTPTRLLFYVIFSKVRTYSQRVGYFLTLTELQINIWYIFGSLVLKYYGLSGNFLSNGAGPKVLLIYPYKVQTPPYFIQSIRFSLSHSVCLVSFPSLFFPSRVFAPIVMENGDGGPAVNYPKTVDEVFRDFKGRMTGMIKALTTGTSFSSSSSSSYYLLFDFSFFLHIYSNVVISVIIMLFPFLQISRISTGYAILVIFFFNGFLMFSFRVPNYTLVALLVYFGAFLSLVIIIIILLLH